MNEKEMQLIRFLEWEGKDNKNRTIETIWLYSDKELEKVHDYIQWIFPLKEVSRANPSCPVLTDEMIQYIRSSEQIQQNMVASFRRMCLFYGMEYRPEENKVHIVKLEKDMKRVWLKPFNHNFKRISRIIGSLTLCGRKDLAQQFYEKVDLVTSGVFYCDSSRSFWKAALLSDV